MSEYRTVSYTRLSALITIRNKDKLYPILKNGNAMGLEQMQHDQIIQSASNPKNQIQALIKFTQFGINTAVKTFLRYRVNSEVQGHQPEMSDPIKLFLRDGFGQKSLATCQY